MPAANLSQAIQGAINAMKARERMVCGLQVDLLDEINLVYEGVFDLTPFVGPTFGLTPIGDDGEPIGFLTGQ